MTQEMLFFCLMSGSTEFSLEGRKRNLFKRVKHALFISNKNNPIGFY